MNRNVPDGWSLTRVSEIATVTSGGTPDRTNAAFYSGVNPWVKSGEVNQRAIRHTEEHISDEAIENSSAKWVNAGAVLVAMYGATAGKVAKLMINATLNQAIAAVVLKKSSFCSDYLFHALEFSSDELLKSLQGSGQPNLSGGLIKELKLLSPPLPEQQKIASILTTVDEVIASTTAQINKLKDLKTGMMQELLTKGIAHTEFKDSPVGRIPKAWEVIKLDDISSYITSGSRGWAEYYSDSGAIFIRIGNLTREHINFRFNDIVYVNPPEGGEGKRTLVQIGDVLISITADLGIVGVVNAGIGEAYVNQHVALVRLNDPKLSRWVGHYLSHDTSQKQFTANNDSGAKAGLNLSAIKNLEIAIPPLIERNKIVQTLDSIDNDIVIRRLKLSRSRDIKKALMQDLLTGKIRVKVNLQ